MTSSLSGSLYTAKKFGKSWFRRPIGIDASIADGVADEPAPTWSVNSQEIVYSTGTQTNVFNLHSSYQVTHNLQLFAVLENIFNLQYYTFGTLSPTSSVPNVLVPGASNPRSYSPGSPIAVTVGLRATF